MLQIQYIDAVILKVLQKRTQALTFTVIKLLPAVLGNVLASETVVGGTENVCTCSKITLSHPVYKLKIKMFRCQLTDTRTCRDLAFSWQSQKLELDLLSHHISHRLSFLYPGTNSCSTCYSDQKNGEPFYTPYPSEAATQRNYSWGETIGTSPE